MDTELAKHPSGWKMLEALNNMCAVELGEVLALSPTRSIAWSRTVHLAPVDPACASQPESRIERVPYVLACLTVIPVPYFSIL